MMKRTPTNGPPPGRIYLDPLIMTRDNRGWKRFERTAGSAADLFTFVDAERAM